MFRPPPTDRPRAFSLAEILICVALLAIALLGLLGAQAYALRSGTSNERRETASVLALSKLAAIAEQAGGDYYCDLMFPVAPVPGFPDFSLAYAGDPVSATASVVPPTRVLTVDVYWTDSTGSQTYELTTRVYEPF